ncbi:tRNA (cytosine(34)-C(5))-methyltransferase [Condylostylus longicornis]|uniref:tRNA (cytosine(34)-C(5))-methyltransferase n=1 Tax=Condylostylus longicornis TaxID=2530218 RepID=UPI00244E0360|nr:tRNA (cytosine(34)-C(5))-methyltransferase [Condylostylus longicornis]
MGRDKKVNPFAKKKRDKRFGQPKPDRRSEPYEEIVRENESFYKYYKAQNICPDNEWEIFLNKIKDNLPTTFRITASKDEAMALLDIIKTEFFEEYTKSVSELHQVDNEEVLKPFCLPWYPDGLGWQLHLSRKDIRRSEPLYKLHNFLIAETNAGAISRQEAVSMIPPIVLDVKPTDKVLDMCAAPGSKTTQLIEGLHSGNQEAIPSGFVVANDIDNNRCYMLVHQAKRLNSPCIVVTNHDSAFLPNMIQTNPNGKKQILKFDKVLCDVPCSGDGTLRKNPDIWLKWNAGQALNLHGIQYRIARRGAEQLAVGGRLVYSTCSLNPIENEAVLQRLVKDSNGALEIVDASHLVPGLKYKPGLTDWKLISRDIEIYTKWDEVPQKYHTVIRPNMFPLPPDEIKEIGLEKCMRVLPHLQDTGAFFVAALIKKKPLEWEKNDNVEKTINEMKSNKNDSDMSKEDDEEKKSVPWGPQRKKRRLDGYKEDPYVFFTENEPVWEDIKSFYELNDSFNKDCLLTRSLIGKKKNIYFCSPEIRDLVINNEDSVKIINTGVKMFVRCDNRNMKCAFRLAQEGLNTSNPFIGKSRRLDLCREDLLKLLYCTDPTKPPHITSMTEDTQNKVEDIKPGSCILKYIDDKFAISLVGWRGTTSLRAYIEQNETIHILRLLKADISQFVVNKFKKSEENSPEITEIENDEKSESIDDDSNNALNKEIE